VENTQELDQLRARVAHLETLVARLAGGTPMTTEAPAPPVHGDGLSRRRMLRNGLGLGAAAVAGVGVLDGLASPAAAADGDAVKVGQTVSPTSATSDPTRITNPSTAANAAVLFQVDNITGSAPTQDAGSAAAILATFSSAGSPQVGSAAIRGLSNGAVGVHGRSGSQAGVLAESSASSGLVAHSDSDFGVRATGSGGAIHASTTAAACVVVDGNDRGVQATGNVALYGQGIEVPGVEGSCGLGAEGTTAVIARGSDIGVYGEAADGIGIKGVSDQHIGMVAEGQTAGLQASSPAVAVSATTTAGTAHSATATTGTGVRAASASGIGAVLSGGTAPLRLLPNAVKGHPTSGTHRRGEFVVDSRGSVWVCTKVGTPGTWKRLAWA
jgi:hypothetical protein